MWITIVGVATAFAAIILLIRISKNFGIAILCGAIIAALFSLETLSPDKIGLAILNAIISWKTIGLAIIVTLVSIIAYSMKETGLTDKLVNNIRGAFPNGGVLAILPAIFGLMPIPGGARISAPMIEDEGKKLGVSNDKMNYLNLWFRHPWPLVFPLTPSIVLAATLSNIELNSLLLIQVPIFIVFILIGYLMLRIFVKKKTHKRGYFNLKETLLALSPILLSLVIFFTFNSGLKVETYLSMCIALLFATLLIFFISRDYKNIPGMLRKGLSLNLALSIFGIMIFRNIIVVSKSLESFSPLLQNSSFHPFLILTIVPLVLGVIIGNNLLAIGLNFILVSSILASNLYVPVVSVLYVSSFIGYLISPLHLCTIVSSEYFKTGLIELYKYLIPSALFVVFINTLIMYVILL
ncbi:hypothetical protein B6U70_01570 [Euryarchaeota archaeon ex4484_162]|nr:MAG: hypothetical protein B6U70_01570 [Euryarchaeota archaeon ex4484_162]RLF61818.1 MAG: hypothetical protein DRN16_03135 [Thermoplasmata archaeon]